MIGTNEKKITPFEFAQVIGKLSIQFESNLTSDQLKEKKIHALDQPMDTQLKINQFIIFDLLKKNNQAELQCAFNFYVKVLEICLNKNDLKSANMIMATLKSPPIFRLRKEKFMINNNKVTIKNIPNACIKTCNEQRKVLIRAEILLNIVDKQKKTKPVSEHFNKEIFQKKAQHSNASSPCLREDSKEDLMHNERENFICQIILNGNITKYEKHSKNKKSITKKTFERLAQARSIDILPLQKNASAFKETKPFSDFLEENSYLDQNDFLYIFTHHDLEDDTKNEKKTKSSKKQAKISSQKNQNQNEKNSLQKVVSIKRRYPLLDKIDSIENQLSLTEILVKKALYYNATKSISNVKKKITETAVIRKINGDLE